LKLVSNSLIEIHASFIPGGFYQLLSSPDINQTETSFWRDAIAAPFPLIMLAPYPAHILIRILADRCGAPDSPTLQVPPGVGGIQ